MDESYLSFCECDLDSTSEFISLVTRNAKKKHRCGECGGSIQIDETYEYAVGKQDGDFWNNKTCLRCLSLIEYIKAHVPCFCRMYGALFEDDDRLEGMIDEARQTPGFAFGIMRKIVDIKRNKRVKP